MIVCGAGLAGAACEEAKKARTGREGVEGGGATRVGCTCLR